MPLALGLPRTASSVDARRIFKLTYCGGVDERDWSEDLNRRIAAVATAVNPYEAALDVTGGTVDHLATSVLASRVYQLWAALQDKFEPEAVAEADALAEMRLAASEWLVVLDDPTARAAYLDHWQYDVLGYERPSQ